MVIFVKYFDSNFIVCILDHLYNMMFKFTPTSSFDNQRKPPLFRKQFDRINGVHGSKVSLICFVKKKKDQSLETHQTTANNIYRFISKHLLYLFFTLNWFCLFIISSEMGYQRSLIAHYNEPPHSLIWVFASNKRK